MHCNELIIRTEYLLIPLNVEYRLSDIGENFQKGSCGVGSMGKRVY